MLTDEELCALEEIAARDGEMGLCDLADMAEAAPKLLYDVRRYREMLYEIGRVCAEEPLTHSTGGVIGRVENLIPEELQTARPEPEPPPALTMADIAPRRRRK